MSQSQNTTLEQAVTDLQDAEEALRQFLDSADRLNTASQVTEKASQSLTEAERALSNHTSAAIDLTTEMTKAARELANTATAIRSIDPAAIVDKLAEQGTVLIAQHERLTAQGEQVTALEQHLTLLTKQLRQHGQRLLWLTVLSGIIVILSLVAAIR